MSEQQADHLFRLLSSLLREFVAGSEPRASARSSHDSFEKPGIS